MASNRRKKPLYEVIRQERSRYGYPKQLDEIESKGPAGGRKVFGRAGEKLRPWLKGPRILQLISGRVELSMPYQLAVAAALCLVLLVLIAYRLGQNSGYKAAERNFSSLAVSRTQPEVTEKVPQQPDEVAIVDKTSTTEIEKGQARKTGNNRIVIQTYAVATHLEPVRKYFAENGIATEIRKIGNTYYLVTEDKYENPERKGTDGYTAKQRIIEIGARYKAPEGYETFGTKPFHDAYGMRFDD
jgi:hypothetical protein